MGISLRHHVVSLVASFLMLLVGLLVGVGLSSEPGLQQTMQNLSEQFKQLSAENSTLRTSVERHEEFERAVLPALVRGRLAGQVIPLLVTARPPDDSVTKPVAEALEAAGAKVPYRLIWRDDFAERAFVVYGGDRASACEKAAGEIARCTIQADERDLQALRKSKLIRIEGRVPAISPTAVVVLGGADDQTRAAADSIDRPVLEALVAGGMANLVACEGSPVVSYMSVYRGLDVSTADNVNLARFRVALVLALADQPGSYGPRLLGDNLPQLK